MKKTISISIRLSEEELNKFKQAARLESYASYSEFIRRTALIEADNVLRKKHGSEGKVEKQDIKDTYNSDFWGTCEFPVVNGLIIVKK